MNLTDKLSSFLKWGFIKKIPQIKRIMVQTTFQTIDVRYTKIS